VNLQLARLSVPFPSVGRWFLPKKIGCWFPWSSSSLWVLEPIEEQTRESRIVHRFCTFLMWLSSESLFSEWRFSGQRFVQNHSEWENVTFWKMLIAEVFECEIARIDDQSNFALWWDKEGLFPIVGILKVRGTCRTYLTNDRRMMNAKLYIRRMIR
jgi:hypothetical protein